MVKGLIGGYVLMGVVVVFRVIWDYFEDNIFWCGLMSYVYFIFCVVVYFVIQVYQDDGFIECLEVMGVLFVQMFEWFVDKYDVIGDI